MRCFVESLAEESKKMIARKACVTGDIIQIQREIVTEVDKVTRATEPLVDVGRL